MPHQIDPRLVQRPRPAFALPDWLPRLVLVLSQGYDRRTFVRDLIAGITVGLVALPLAMAFAIASGLTPQAGIYCAIITGFIISALGGSRYQIGGPTGAFVVVVSGIVATYGLDGLFTCTLMAGIILVLMGVTGTGTAVKYIPRPVIVGFTNGIALVIASTQIKDFLGLTVEVPGEFLARMEVLGAHLGETSFASLGLGLASLATILLCNRYIRQIPGYIAALFLGTAISVSLGLEVETIGTRFGGIPSGMPDFQLPQFSPRLALELLSPAMTVAVLGAIESLLSAVVSDRMGNSRHNPNTELFAQGVANIVSPLFGGLPATGALARTATNIRAGAETPVAGVVHALTLLAVLLFAAPLASHIPLAVLAAILFVVAWNMGEWAEIPEIARHAYADIAVWLTTFALTVFADLTVAVEVGMVLAALMFIRRVARTTTVTRVTAEYIESGRAHSLQNHPIPPGVAIYRIHGPFLFGSTDKLLTITDEIEHLPPVVVLRMRNSTAMDATGLTAIGDLAAALRLSGRTLILCGALSQPAALLRRARFEQHLGAGNICGSVEEAMQRASEILAAAPPVPEPASAGPG